jgi:hypothetical protein
MTFLFLFWRVGAIFGMRLGFDGFIFNFSLGVMEVEGLVFEKRVLVHGGFCGAVMWTLFCLIGFSRLFL